ncbi:MAG: RsbRD N-terminal domain-containing protein [Deltaproteobacteria bacterium]|nr:RsbRD N-terminal domain-containing protein [Deltaproteobacteria bacterium]
MFISQRLVKVIEENAEELSARWIKDVLSRPETKTYKTLDPEALRKRIQLVYSQLSQWISQETEKEKVAAYYTAMGAQRHKEGFAISEVVYALILARRHIWLQVLSSGMLDTALQLNQALELDNRVVLYFDRAIHYTCVGYEKG